MALSTLFEEVTVDTQLFDRFVTPGGLLTGIIRFKATSGYHEICGISLEFDLGEQHPGVARRRIEFHQALIDAEFTLGPGDEHTVPFQIRVPWETPITDIGGTWLEHIFVEVRTRPLMPPRRVGNLDADLIRVLPMPVQHRIFEALQALGHRLEVLDSSLGLAPLEGSALPVSQHLAFSGRINVGFVAGPTSLDMDLRHSVTSRLRHDAFDLINGELDGPRTYIHSTKVRSTVEYSWLDEGLDWEGWIAERVAAVRSVR